LLKNGPDWVPVVTDPSGNCVWKSVVLELGLSTASTVALDGVAAIHARQGQRLEIALGIGVLGETAIRVERELMLIPVGVRQSAHETGGIVRQSRNRAVGRLYAGQIPVGIDG
jgi:hypothetical protein